MTTFIDVNGKLIYRFTNGSCFYVDGFERESEHIEILDGGAIVPSADGNHETVPFRGPQGADRNELCARVGVEGIADYYPVQV